MTDEAKVLKIATDRPHAPLIIFEGSLACAHTNGLISVTLSADLHLQDNHGVIGIEKTVVGYLKTTVAGAISLRELLDKALLAARPSETAAKN